MSRYRNDTKGELAPTVIVQFDANYPDLWMSKQEYEANGSYQGLLKSFPLRHIVKVHHLLKNPKNYPTADWP